MFFLRLDTGGSRDYNHLDMNPKKVAFIFVVLALGAIPDLNTSGSLTRPLVTMHTEGDPIIPYWNEPLYSLKTLSTGSAREHVNIPILAYGHCAFNAAEIVAGFEILISKTGGTASVTSLAVTCRNRAVTERLRSADRARRSAA